MSDLFVSIGIVSAGLALTLAYALRGRRPRDSRDERTARLLRPLGALVAASRVPPETLKTASLAPAAGAGVAFATGHFGWGALLAIVSTLVGHVGAVQRESAPSANLAEPVGAAVDRYRETFPFFGLALHYRTDVSALLLVLAALAGSFMKSYAAAKAEAMGVRGTRRPESGPHLLVGAVLTPIVGAVFPSSSGRELLILASLALVALSSNASAVLHFAELAARLRARKAGQEPSSPGPDLETAVAAAAELPGGRSPGRV